MGVAYVTFFNKKRHICATAQENTLEQTFHYTCAIFNRRHLSFKRFLFLPYYFDIYDFFNFVLHYQDFVIMEMPG